MKKRLLFLIYFLVYWLFFFLFARLVFLIYNLTLSSSLTADEWLSIFWYGSRMDISMSGYISIIAAIILAATAIFQGKTVAGIMKIYNLTVLVLISILVVSDMELYRHWGFRLDSTPLSYLKNPQEAFGSADFGALVIQLMVLALLISSFWLLYIKLLAPVLKQSQSSKWYAIPVFLSAGIIMILPIRGSLGVAPMNIGFVYFHPNKIFANHSAINVVWNAGKSLLSMNTVKEYHFMDDQKAKQIFAGCYPQSAQTDILLKTSRPNIVIIILESFTNRMIETIGGLPGITPSLNKLCKEGIVFTSIYSNSDRTDKGILGVLNGYPAHPVAKVINFTEKIRKLPYLNKDMKTAGYHTEFVFGYDIRYSNFASYFGNAQYDHVITREDFPPETYRDSKWGVHDHLVLEKLLDQCNNSSEPFFKAFMALSSHEPFIVPMPTAIEGNDEENLFLNSAYYSDKAVGDFINAAKQSKWWDNTLIVITSDHGSRHPGYATSYDPVKFNVPMIWVGGAISKKDTIITTIASQTDIPLTILHQIGIQNQNYTFSKDILGSPVYPFAFYDFNDGFGFIDDSCQMVFDNISHTIIWQKGENTGKAAEIGQAYLQTFSDDFVKK